MSDTSVNSNSSNSTSSSSSSGGSGGPRTAAGKERSAANAIKHGLSGRTFIVRDDEHDDYAAFLQQWESDMKPAGAAEMEVFAQLIQAAWQSRRISRAEAELIDASLTDPLLADDAAGQSKLRLYSTYQSRAERAFHKALTTLRELQEERLFRMSVANLQDPSIPKLPRLVSVRRALERDKQTAGMAKHRAIMEFINTPMPRP